MELIIYYYWSFQSSLNTRPPNPLSESTPVRRRFRPLEVPGEVDLGGEYSTFAVTPL